MRYQRWLTLLLSLSTPVAAQQHHHTANRAVAPATDVRVSRVRLANGVSLDVAERGRTDGQPVLFLHGFTDSRYSFEMVVANLPSDIRAISPSQRGQGDSDRPGCCYALRDFAADAAALLDALGIRKATIVGHSLGSFVAQRFASDFPDRVERLVLMGSGFTPQTRPVIELSQYVQTLTDSVPKAFIREFQETSVALPIPRPFMERAIAESEKVPVRVWRDGLAGLVANPAAGDFTRFKSPTLVMWGTKEPLFDRAQQDQLVRAIPGSRFIAYDSVGHSPHWEQPKRVATDLVSFIREGRASAGPERSDGDSHSPASSDSNGMIPLLTGLGDWHLDVTTRAAEAQRFFDQGLRLVYAFNHDEAVRSFERAVSYDSSCALCYWGIAWALGPNINLPMDPAAEPRALAAARRAMQLGANATRRERALIRALARRYAEPAGRDRAARDSAFAVAMRTVAREFPSDADIQTIFADAMLNLRPWNQWTRAGRPQPGTLEVVRTLERVIRRAPDHAGACHLYIHTVEASNTPERALPCAERLPRLMPGAGHVVHMPSHVFLRVGRYEEAARSNIAAVETDARYFTERDVPDGMYPMFYAPHNLHFLWATYALSGQRAKALGAARALTERVKPDDAKAVPSLEGFLVSEGLTYVRFGDWDTVLSLPAPAAELRFSRGIWHYARGMARVARGELAEARTELDSVQALARRIPADVIIILNPAPALLNVGSEILAGRIASAAQQHEVALGHFRAATRLEDALTYDEPPPWYHTARNFLGEALLEAGRPADAEAVFREDLRFVRETGWSLSGLERALRQQGRAREAVAVNERFAKAWVHADGAPTRGR